MKNDCDDMVLRSIKKTTFCTQMVLKLNFYKNQQNLSYKIKQLTFTSSPVKNIKRVKSYEQLTSKFR